METVTSSDHPDIDGGWAWVVVGGEDINFINHFIRSVILILKELYASDWAKTKQKVVFRYHNQEEIR